MNAALSSIGQDLRYALRQLRRSPGFAATAVLTLGLGIGATVTMSSVVRGVLLEPLPYPEQDRLVGLGFTFPQEKPNNEQAGTVADFIVAHSRSFASFGIAEDGVTGANLWMGDGSSGQALQVGISPISQGYFATLGLQPMLGRNFTRGEDSPGGPKAALLSYGLWTRLFNQDTGVVNRLIHINGESYTVVGVMPPSPNDMNESAKGRVASVDLWQPLQLGPKDPGYGGDNYKMIARLKPGVSMVQAQQELDALKEPFYKQYPTYRSWTTRSKLLHDLKAWPLRDVEVSNVRASVLTLMGAVVAVLLIACLNLAGLMTARGSRRAQEIALQTALGAKRSRVMRLLMCESLLLALAGACLGMVLARVMIPALLSASPLPLPLMSGTSNAVLAGLSLALAAVTTLFGLIPAFSVLRPDTAGALQCMHTAGTSAKQAKLGKFMIVGQVAVAMVLLSGASLLLGSFLKLRSVNPGLEPKRLAIAQVTLKGDAYATTLHTTQFVEKVMARLREYPGVERVAAVNGLPLDRGLNTGIRPADRPETMQNSEVRLITPGYFRTLGIPIMSGRDVNGADSATSTPVVLVSETAARRWWPGRSPIGERVVAGGNGEAKRTIVGVVGDIHSHSLAEDPRIVIYEPFTQSSDELTKIVNGWFPTTFAIRLSGDIDMAKAVQQAVTQADPEIPVAKYKSMQAVIDGTLGGPQFFSWMAGGFAGFALLLTAIGLFGLLSYQVTQRTREIGVRLAVGANRSQILLLILRRSFVLTMIGLAAGTITSLAVPRLVSSVLADNVFSGGKSIATVLSSSTIAIVAAAATLLTAALAASYLPARRAAAIEPTQALRTE